MIQGIVETLACEAGLPFPDWVTEAVYLDEPWFPSDMQSLKATALLESPLAFRRRNIFVLDNFLQRA